MQSYRGNVTYVSKRVIGNLNYFGMKKLMPFTPFHMGPGAAIKAVTGGRFSLTVFGFAQVSIDIEPLIRMLRGDSVIHGVTHTYIGALLIGMFSLFVGKIVCQWLLRLWNTIVNFKYLKWLQINANISWLAASTGAFVGTFSHVLLDSIMHSDIQPFLPFSASNGLLGIMSAGWLYLFCAVLGVFGLMVIVVVGLWHKWAIEVD